MRGENTGSCMRLIDSHCHLEDERFRSRLHDVLQDARDAGVIRLVTCAVTPEEWPGSADIARQHPEVACALGIHPWFVKPEYRDHLDRLRQARELGAKAIGEIGLDKKIETPGMDLQTEFFEAQLKIAKELDLPVNIHCRGAFNELLVSLRRVGMPSPGGLIHAFSGNVQIARTFVEFGLNFSLGRSLTYKKCRKREELMAFIYPDHFLLETDSPDMVPIGADPEMPNEPKNIVFNLRGAADVLGREEAEVAETTTQNALHLFNLES